MAEALKSGAGTTAGRPGTPDRRGREDQFVVRALARALAMLNLFDAEHREWSLDEMAAAIGSPRMTAYRSARTLQSAVYLVSDAVTGSHWLVWQCVPDAGAGPSALLTNRPD